MQNINYWKQFENTGKIEDYLSYKSCRREPGYFIEDKGSKSMDAKEDENPYAGVRMCDRNHFEADAHRGI